MNSFLTTTSWVDNSADLFSNNLVEELQQSRQQCSSLEQKIKELEAEAVALKSRIEELEAENQWLKRRLFGRRSEKPKNSQTSETATTSTTGNSENESTTQDDKKKRGGQMGHIGHGRQIPNNLPKEERFYDIPEDQRRCSICGLPAIELPMTEDSYEVDVRVEYVTIVHRRKKYKKMCSCPSDSLIITAAQPSKVIPKGKFTADFWARTIVDKYLLQLPIQRQTLAMQLEGLEVPKSTLVGGFSTLSPMFSPLYEELIQLSRLENHWHIDETRWRMFVEHVGKKTFNWWLWVFASKSAVCYVLDPSRSKTVPQNFFDENASGIISADRYAVYKSMSGDFVISFCWSHVRRDFDNIVHRYQNNRDKKYLADWANLWIDRIGRLYHINNQRVTVLDISEKFQYYNRQLINALTKMEMESKKDYPHWEQTKVMSSLQNHWDGLNVFVEHPEIPMDNNEAERRLRNPALGRNNYYGHHSEKAGEFAAMQFSIIQSCILNGINPRAYSSYYLEACAKKQKPPENIEDYLPHVIKEKALYGDPICRKLLIHQISDDP